MDLRNVRVLITGASRGIGAAMARAFADAGARVALAARSVEDIGALADELGGSSYPVDLTDSDQLDELYIFVNRDSNKYAYDMPLHMSRLRRNRRLQNDELDF